MRASSTVFVKASSLVKRDLADILVVNCDTVRKSLAGTEALRSFQRGSNGGRHERECDETDPGLRSGRKSLERCHKRQKSIGLDDHGAEQLKPASQVRWG